MNTPSSSWRDVPLLMLLPLLVGQPLVGSGGKAEVPSRTLDDASMLAQVSQAVLAGEPEEDEVRSAPGLMAPLPQQDQPPVDQTLIAAQLTAVRAELRQLEALCSNAQEANAKDACFLEQLKESCDRKREKLKAQYEILREIRGDRRKLTTKFFATVNRVRREI